MVNAQPSLDPSRLPRQRERIPVIIDTDPGIDDLVAVAMAARAPSLDLIAITTTYGNASLASTTRNAAELLRLAGRAEVAVRPGADRPLVRSAPTAPEMHGVTGAGHAPVPHAAVPAATPNEQVLAELLADQANPVTLVTLGPLTNLAHALRHNPEAVRSLVKQHIGICGCFTGRATGTRWADFNSWADPEAASLVVRSGIRTKMIGIDTTRSAVLASDEVASLALSPDPLVRWLAEALRYYVTAHEIRDGLGGCYVHDALAVVELLRPGLLKFDTRSVRIDLDDGAHRGHTRVGPDGTCVQVAIELDIAMVSAMIAHVMGIGWSAQLRAGDEK
jgi:inosine-uridine nucleoside N-ribohydrolase